MTDGAALRDLLPGLALNAVQAQGDEAADVDTADDLSRWRGRTGRELDRGDLIAGAGAARLVT